VNLHKNTVFSLLETLCALGYARQWPNSHDYGLGHRLFEFARQSDTHLDVIQVTRPTMLRLVNAFNETTSLAVPLFKDVLIVSTVESSHGVRGARFQGQHAPYHASAVGKAILAFLPHADRDNILAAPELPRLTRKTTKLRAALLRELDETAKRGYAISLEEEEIGANAVAAPLVSPMGEVIGALAVWGPAPRLTIDRLGQLGSALVKECRNIFAV
jgi:DNA-binding IclR family transcriptional regulator